MTVYTFDGFPNGTDVGDVPGWTRDAGNAGSMIVNADGNIDIVSVSPNSLYTCSEGAGADMSMEVTWQTTGGGNYYNCCVRVTDINNLYGSRVDSGGNISIAKVVSGTITQLAATSVGSRAIGDRQRFDIEGDSLKAYYNDVLLLDITDSSITTGNKMGFFNRSTTGVDRFTSVTVEAISAYNITSVNDDDELDSGVENTAVVVGYDDGVNPVVSGTVGSLAVTDVSQTDDVVTFTIPEPENASYWPEPDTTQTLTLTDGSNSSTLPALFNSLAGCTSVVIDTPDNSDEYKLGYHATTPPVNGDKIMADFTVNPDTSFEGVSAGVHVWYHWVSATSTMYIYEATFGSGGIILSTRSGYIGYGLGIGF